MKIQVECYSGHRGDETPRVVVIGSKRIPIAEVLDAWIGPDHRYFKVTDQSGETYILRHDHETLVWDLVVYESART